MNNKLEKVVKLADAMYYAAQNLTTDASRLHKAMEDYHQFIINDYCKEAPASEDLEKYKEFVASELPQGTKVSQNGEFTIDVVKALIKDAVKLGVQWQKEQMMKAAIDATTLNSDYPTRLELNTKLNNVNAMDEVKVIIIKE